MFSAVTCPVDLERLAVTHAICAPPLEFVSMTPSTGDGQLSPALVLLSHAKITMRYNLQPVINKKRGEASWMELSGMTPSWAKPAFKLAFFIKTVSKSAIFTDGMSQSILGFQRLLNVLSGVLNPQSWSVNNTERLEWARCLLHKYYFSLNRLERSGLKQLSSLIAHLTLVWPTPGSCNLSTRPPPRQVIPLTVITTITSELVWKHTSSGPTTEVLNIYSIFLLKHVHLYPCYIIIYLFKTRFF